MNIEVPAEFLQDFHGLHMRVMKAVQATNKDIQGRPLAVKKAYLEKNHPEEASLAVMVLSGHLEMFYVGLQAAAQTQPSLAVDF